VTLDARDLSRLAVSPAPFAAAALLAWLAVPIGSSMDWTVYAVSVAVLALTGALMRLSHSRWCSPKPGQLTASVAFLTAVGLLRGAAGGAPSGTSVLAMLPVFYIALSGMDRRQLYAVLVAVAAFYLIPIIVIGSPPYPHSQYRTALLTVAISSIVGVATQRLVGRVRHEAAEAGRRERMLEQVSHVVRGLFDSFQARQDVCDASRAISDATVAILFEPRPGGGLLSTAMAGLDAAPFEILADNGHPVHEAFRTGHSRLISGELASQLLSQALWEVCGRPRSVLYQPLIRDGAVVGVLVVGWPAETAVAGSRATVIALLAHEAALAINRADQIEVLAGMAQTDPLTGLPNRRAWDGRLRRAVHEGQGFTVAMLDLDHFKRFNDSYGHPAGDRLLKETAAVWREQVRNGDLLARLGGEEFGLLLFDCDLAAASNVTERLRSLVTHDQTCSVGLALRQDGESVESVVSRADSALYVAKASGRDRACLSA
jgi:diguanylate cyclase (GGDEF)-like protein